MGNAPVLSESHLADMLDLDVKTLQNWRAAGKGKGPKFHRKTGRLVLYLMDDVIDWVRSEERELEAAPAPKRGRPRKQSGLGVAA